MSAINIVRDRLRPNRDVVLSGRRDWRLVVAVPILVSLVVVGLFGRFIAPYGSLQGNLLDALKPPVFFGGTWSHVLGTDAIGRDILSRIILGAGVTLAVAGVTLLVGAGVGTAAGLVAGYLGGWVDSAIMRIVDVVISFPPILPPLLLAGAIGPSTTTLVVAIALIIWAPFARLVRAEVLVVRKEGFVASARVSGVPAPMIILRHLLPNVANTVVVLGVLQVGWLILAQSMLSFVGAGLPPPAPDWGGMIASGTDYISTAWWVPTMPGFAIIFTVLAFNLAGDWLQDRQDPRRLVAR
jgi:peptide/nickel transport system permease protein